MDKYRLVEERTPLNAISTTSATAVGCTVTTVITKTDNGKATSVTPDVAKAKKASAATNKVDEEGEEILSNEVRITQQGKPRNYISYAMNLLTNQNQNQIILKAMGRAVNKAVTIAEILKRKAQFHQITSLSSVEIVDIYDPIEEGLDRVESKRYVSCINIVLSRSPLDTTDIGYQPPLPLEEMQPGDTRPGREVASSSAGSGGGDDGAGGFSVIPTAATRPSPSIIDVGGEG